MELLYLGPDDGATLVLAHGAGAAMDSGWMSGFCALLADRGIRTARFEFGYMAARRSGTRKPAPRAEAVTEEYLAALDAVDAERPFIGGKSYGGRVASLIAQESWTAGRIAGLVCLGYPFHPPGKPEQLRTAHLAALECPTLICQGTRDEFGGADEVPGFALSPTIAVHWLEDGDHGFRPRKAISGRTERQNLAEAADAVTAFMGAATAV
ncbi:dienelactone hydrolase [Leifsonia sp. H3M29-4]|uniref:alpha/beta family hydrolase n=1 Tax=Salinibacterium metalliresistens TaxID=3031321 RepID=UPI0023DC7B15|nr:alpha/beta family hydrolase [Salinibacterium metalliresistens]MDF1479303.1 dienelactone hydrolase [Salinibacterium metalliresistens]